MCLCSLLYRASVMKIKYILVQFVKRKKWLQECWLFLSNVITLSSIIKGYFRTVAPAFIESKLWAIPCFLEVILKDVMQVSCVLLQYMERYIIYLAPCCIHLGNIEFKSPCSCHIGSSRKLKCFVWWDFKGKLKSVDFDRSSFNMLASRYPFLFLVKAHNYINCM